MAAMANAICAVDGCEREARTRGWCQGHYVRVRRRGEPGPAAFKKSSPGAICIVPGCGAVKSPNAGRGMCSIHYGRWQRLGDATAPLKVSPQQGRICRVDGCGRGCRARGLCRRHYDRMRSTGTPGFPCKTCSTLFEGPIGRLYCSDECAAVTCKARDCEGDPHARGWCPTHYQRWRHTGTSDRECVTCQQPMFGSGSNAYCSTACRPRCKEPDCDRPARVKGLCSPHYVDDRYPGRNLAIAIDGRPATLACATCAGPIDLHERSAKSGRFRRSDSKLCRKCRPWRFRNTGLSLDQVADRTQGRCGICGQLVDRSVMHPHPHSLSVDHILPRSLGGGDEIENLRIAHLACNRRRGNRIA